MATLSKGQFEEWLSSLKSEEFESVQRGLAEGVLYGPSPGPQALAYASPAKVTGYGGSAGGGKSGLIALLAVNEHHRSVIFRSDGKQIRQLVQDCSKFAGTDDNLNWQQSTFKPGRREGQLIEWGGVRNMQDVMAWRGREHDLICFDEATELSEQVVRFLTTWNRTASQGQRCRVLLTFNPPGGPTDESSTGGRWVVDWFAPWIDERHPNPARPGELRWFVRTGEEAGDKQGQELEVPDNSPYEMKLRGKVMLVQPESRTFIPARYTDNPYINEDYITSLAMLDEAYRAQMIMGDFRSGITDSPNQVIPTAWVDDAMSRWTAAGRRQRHMDAIGVDVAAGGRDFTVVSRRHGWWFDEIKRIKGTETPDGHMVAAFVTQWMRDSAPICIDAVSWGSSAKDILGPKGMNLKVIAVNGGAAAGRLFPKLERGFELRNERCAMWWAARKMLDPANGLDVALPKDNRLRSDLITVRYKMRGKHVDIETKADVKARIGRSTDDADALLCTLVNIRDTPGWTKIMSGASNSQEIPTRDAAGRLMSLRRRTGGNNAWMSR